MVTRQELEGHWNEVRGRIQERWGQFTNDELQEAQGDANQLVGVIQRKTGESRKAIEDFLEQVIGNGASFLDQAAEKVQEYAGRASESVSEYAGRATDTAREGYDRVASQMQTGLDQAEECVRRNPMESVAVAFGAGIITGVVLGLALKSR